MIPVTDCDGVLVSPFVMLRIVKEKPIILSMSINYFGKYIFSVIFMFYAFIAHATVFHHNKSILISKFICYAHYDDVIMSAIASQITSLTIVYSTVYPGADQSKHQSSASLAFVWGIHRGPVNSPHKWPVTRKRFPFDDVIMEILSVASKILWTINKNDTVIWVSILQTTL